MAVNGVDDQSYRIQQNRARDAQKDAQKQISDSEKQVADARQAADHEITNLRDQFSQQYMTQEEKQADQLQQQRTKAYEEMLRTKRQQEAEIMRIKRQADKEIHDIHANADTEITQADAKGKKTLTQIDRTINATKEHQQRAATKDLELEGLTHQARMTELQENHEQTFENLKKQRDAELARTKEGFFRANMEAIDKYESAYKNSLQTQNESLDRLNGAASRKLNELRADSSMKLAAYDNRSADPFYRMIDTSARLVDHDQFYQVLAKVPEHEREHVSVAIRGNQIVLSGQRRNMDSVDIAPGQTRKTEAFQAYSETFPISWPVEAKGITKYYDGDTLVVTIPKKPIDSREQFQAKDKSVQKIASARPDFPDNLPVTAEQLRKAAPTTGKA